MIEHRQRLPLRLKPPDDLTRSDPELDDFDSDGLANGFAALGAVDLAHAALAEQIENPIWSHALRPAMDLLAGNGGARRCVECRIADGSGGSFRHECDQNIPTFGI